VPAGRPGDLIARCQIFLRGILQTEGMLVKPEKVIGASRLNRNSNSEVIYLILVNCVENHREFRQM
jgi:hypothetical protein